MQRERVLTVKNMIVDLYLFKYCLFTIYVR